MISSSLVLCRVAPSLEEVVGIGQEKCRTSPCRTINGAPPCYFIFDKTILLRVNTEIPFFGAQTTAQRIHNVWFQFAETSVWHGQDAPNPLSRLGRSRAQRHLEKSGVIWRLFLSALTGRRFFRSVDRRATDPTAGSSAGRHSLDRPGFC